MSDVFLIASARSARFHGLRAAIFAGMVAVAPARAEPDSMSREAPALAGHAAEAAMRDEEAERRHRRLFFDSVRLEEGEPGVACDHRAHRPEAIAGRGSVLVAVDARSGRALARLWLPPAPEGTAPVEPGAPEARLRALVARLEPAATERPAIERRDFVWCR